MCQDCQHSAEELRAQIEALRAEMEKLKHERDEATKHAEEMRKRMSAERAAQRMMQWKVPQDIIDEFINVYNAVPEGDQDKLISVVGRMIDHIRSAVSTDANPSLRVDAVRAALVQQMTPYEQPSSVPDESRKQIEEDIKWIRSQFVKGGAK
jgi:chromosome segregation ATPase